MKKVSLGVLAAGIIAMGTVSCSKDDSIATGKEKAKAIYSQIEDLHDDSTSVTEGDFKEFSDVNDIPYSGVQEYTGMLHFEDWNAVANVLEKMEYKTQEALDKWENSIDNFTSLRKYNNDIAEDNVNIDQLEQLVGRMPDRYAETLLNSDLECRIADTVYKTSADFESYSKYLVADGEIEEEPFGSGGLRSCGPCSSGHSCNTVDSCWVQQNWCENAHASYENCLVVGWKYVTNNIFRSRLGIKVAYYALNIAGVWRAEDPPTQGGGIPYLASLTDHYYDIVYYVPADGSSSTNPITLTGTRGFLGAARELDYNIESYIPRKRICVKEWGRTHNWAAPDLLAFFGTLPNISSYSYFNDDCHCDFPL